MLFFARLTFNSLTGGGASSSDGDMRTKVSVVDLEVVMPGRLYQEEGREVMYPLGGEFITILAVLLSAVPVSSLVGAIAVVSG